MGFWIKTPLALPSKHFSDDGSFTWEDWHRIARVETPVRYWLQFTVPRWFRHVWSYPKEFAYWVRAHTRDRYHIIDLRGPGIGLDYRWGWVDRSEAILLAAFTLLKDFVEREAPELGGELTGGREAKYGVDWREPGPWADAGREISILYRWWMVDRQAEHAAHQDRFQYPRTQEERHAWLADADALDDRDREMLARLICVREFLWT